MIYVLVLRSNLDNSKGIFVVKKQNLCILFMCVMYYVCMLYENFKNLTQIEKMFYGKQFIYKILG